MEGRAIAIDATLEEYRPRTRSSPRIARSSSRHGPLWERQDYSRREVASRPADFLHKWGMAIDLSSCTGCNACLIACQAENNIPCGRQAGGQAGPRDALAPHRPLLRRRQRHRPADLAAAGGLPAVRGGALRERLPGQRHDSQPGGPERHGVQPLHRDALLRQQLPLQGAPVQLPRLAQPPRRQPWQMHGNFPETRKMVFNPNVTVRMRGVMEKCTYCVQRIQEAKFRSRREHRDLADGDIVTACEAGLPERRHHLRRPQRRDLRVAVAASHQPALPAPCRGRRAAAHHLPREDPQPQPRHRSALRWGP